MFTDSLDRVMFRYHLLMSVSSHGFWFPCIQFASNLQLHNWTPYLIVAGMIEYQPLQLTALSIMALQYLAVEIQS